MTTRQGTDSNVVLVNQEFDVVGTRPIRHDGADKVTGRARYGADFQAADLLRGRVLRSPHAHARIKSIDTSKAEALEGVRAVVTSKDFPTNDADKPARHYQRENVLAGEKALYVGHAIVGVAAVSEHVAEEALSLIDIEYEVLPPVTSAPQGMASDSQILHEEMRTDESGEKGTEPSNVATHFQQVIGDIEEGFAKADFIIERDFDTATVHQGYIEPQNGTALWNNDGRLHVWTSTQGAFPVRTSMSQILDIPVSKIRVTPMEIGGGFGGKIPVYLEPVAALLSRKTGRPVKMQMSRREVFEGTGPTPGSHVKVKMGATRDGKLTAAQAHLAYEAGAFPGSPVGAGATCVFACYNIPNIVIDGYDVVVNKPKTAAYRAPGATNAAFASETVVDMLAEKVGMDPLDFRMLNTSREGTRRADGTSYGVVGCAEVIEAMRSHPHYASKLEGPNRGRGVAVGFWMNIGWRSACSISVNYDGTINLLIGSTDIGGTRASIAMQAAEVLGISPEDVNPAVVDTDSIGYTDVTGGSRTTFATGWAAHEAAVDVRNEMVKRAAILWEIEPENIEFNKSVFRSKSDPELSISFKELARKMNDTGGGVVGKSTVDPKGVGVSFAGAITDVEIDPETGKVTVLRFTCVQDVGKAVHPSYVEGQMQGGSVQGIGWGLNEEYYMNPEGGMDNFTLLDYRMPTSLDIPMIDTVIVEVANPGHPYGVRGVGEASIIAPPAAIADAIHNAMGIRLENLPMNPPAVLAALSNGNSES